MVADMMAVLYNFVKVDTETFLSDSKHVEVIISMCKAVSYIEKPTTLYNHFILVNQV